MQIARGEKAWVPMLEEFWRPFIKLVKEIEALSHDKMSLKKNSMKNAPNAANLCPFD